MAKKIIDGLTVDTVKDGVRHKSEKPGEPGPIKRLVSEEAIQRAQHQHLQDAEFQDEQAKKNPPFLQVDKPSINPIRQLARRAPAAHQVLLLFVEKMNRTNAIAITQKTLAKILQYDARTIRRAITLLETERWVQIVKLGTQHAYVVNSKVFWQSTRLGRFAVFHATIIADEADQTYKAEDWDNIKLKQVPVLQEGERLIISNSPTEPPDQGELDIA